MNTVILGAVLAIIFVLAPIIGNWAYHAKKKKVSIIFLTITLLLMILTLTVLTTQGSMPLGEYYGNYFSQPRFGAADYTMIYIIFLSFVCAGMGLIGGILENVGEQTEESEVYKDIKKVSSRIKLYFFYMIYGYIFIFAEFSTVLFLINGFNLQIKDNYIIIADFLHYMLFDNIILIIIGSILFGIKTVKYGPFSMEYYRSEYDPKVQNMKKWVKYINRLIGNAIGTAGVFSAVLVYYLKGMNDPSIQNITRSFSIPLSFFYLTAAVQSLYFYLNKERFIDQLKPVSSQYGLKVGRGPGKTPSKITGSSFGLSVDQEDISDESIDAELKFDDDDD